jgi:hypothetical protein
VVLPRSATSDRTAGGYRWEFTGVDYLDRGITFSDDEVFILIETEGGSHQSEALVIIMLTLEARVSIGFTIFTRLLLGDLRFRSYFVLFDSIEEAFISITQMEYGLL